ncbi:MAG: hypothetical protein ACFFCS_25405, partial [Candidatus Hodarchaeota archaeon]
MNQTNVKISTRAWIVSCALFLVTVILFSHAAPVGNNFDQERYFTLYLVLPELLVLLAVIFLQRFVDRKILIAILAIFQVVVLFLFSFVSLSFEIYNADNLIFIFSYMMIYHKYLYSAMITAIPSLMYLSLLGRIEQFKKVGLSTKN